MPCCCWAQHSARALSSCGWPPDAHAAPLHRRRWVFSSVCQSCCVIITKAAVPGIAQYGCWCCALVSCTSNNRPATPPVSPPAAPCRHARAPRLRQWPPWPDPAETSRLVRLAKRAHNGMASLVCLPAAAAPATHGAAARTWDWRHDTLLQQRVHLLQRALA